MTPEEEREIRILNEQSLDAIIKHEQRRSLIFAEEAAGYLAEVYGGGEAVRILRALAQHIEDYG